MKAKKLDDSTWLLNFVKGDRFLETFTAFLEEKNIQAASFSAIGAFDDVDIAFYDREVADYVKKNYKEFFEVTSLLGNVSLFDGKPLVHAHCTLGRKDYSVLAGHLCDAQVAVVLELFLKVYPSELERKEEGNLKLIDIGQ